MADAGDRLRPAAGFQYEARKFFIALIPSAHPSFRMPDQEPQNLLADALGLHRSIRVFRQTRAGDWQAVVSEVAQALGSTKTM
jgi:hypothetical protein